MQFSELVHVRLCVSSWGHNQCQPFTQGLLSKFVTYKRGHAKLCKVTGNGLIRYDYGYLTKKSKKLVLTQHNN